MNLSQFMGSVCLFLGINQLSAQSVDSEALRYEQSQVLFQDDIHTIHIHLNSQTFDKIVNEDACKEDRMYGHVKEFRLNNQQVQLNNVGMRVRGNTSCANFKKQYKIKFTEDELFENSGQMMNFSEEQVEQIKSQRLLGLKSISLRASANDSTILRDKLSTELFNQATSASREQGMEGTPVNGGMTYRVGFTRLFVKFDSGTYQDFGLYNITENVDREFVKLRYPKPARGHLFKSNIGKADLTVGSESINHYEPKMLDGKKAKDDEKAIEILKQLTNQIASAKSREDLAQFIDVDNFLNYIAISSFVGHWDSLIGNANNDYLFFNKETQKWQVFVWDLDNTFGITFAGYNTYNANLNEILVNGKNIIKESNRPLFYKILNLYSEEYKEKVDNLLETTFQEEKVQNRIINLRNMFTGGHSSEEKWESLFRFKNARHKKALQFVQ